MAKIHVLGASGVNTYTVVVHTPVPGGNNTAGVPWSDALVASGRNKTVMKEGTTPGYITAAEKASVEAGTTIEGTFAWQDDPAWTNTERQADLDRCADQLIAELQSTMGALLKCYGFTRT